MESQPGTWTINLSFPSCWTHISKLSPWPSFTYTHVKIPLCSLNCITPLFFLWIGVSTRFSAFTCIAFLAPLPALGSGSTLGPVHAANKVFWPWTQPSVQDLVCTTHIWSISSAPWIIHQMSLSSVICLQHKLWEYESKIFGVSELLRSRRQNISVHEKSTGINVT